MNAEKNLRRALRRGHLPGEEAASLEAWPLVMQAYADAPRRSSGSTTARRALLPAAAAAAIAVLTLTPPGEAVTSFVRKAVTTSAPRPKAIGATTLPGGGRLLVAGKGGLFAVGAGRAPQRFFGDADQATWSAHGKFVAATRGIELIAVSLKGNRHWSLHHNTPILDPRWDQDDGFRVVYRTGGSLWTVFGNGMYDRRIGPAAPVAPAFRPHAKHQIAYAQSDGSIIVLSLDSGRVIAHTAPRLHPISLAWSPDGKRLLALSPQWLWVISLDGHFLRRVHAPRGMTNVSASWSPHGNSYAVVRLQGARTWHVVLTTPHRSRTLFSLRSPLDDILWSPDGKWLVADAQRQDQWLFLRPDAHGGLAAIRTISDVAKRFGGGKAASLQGWTAGS